MLEVSVLFPARVLRISFGGLDFRSLVRSPKTSLIAEKEHQLTMRFLLVWGFNGEGAFAYEHI